MTHATFSAPFHLLKTDDYVVSDICECGCGEACGGDGHDDDDDTATSGGCEMDGCEGAVREVDK